MSSAITLKGHDATRFDTLRRKHPRFIYEGFEIDRLSDALRLRFRFKLEPDITFTPETIIERVDWERIESVGEEGLRNLVFHLGLIETLSYWKAACSPEIIISAGSLDEDQIAWWHSLLIRGMGEFFYANRIDFRGDDLVQLSFTEEAPRHTPFRIQAVRDSDLVLVSGGKDSALTLEILRRGNRSFHCLLLNPRDVALAVASTGECRSPIVVRRTIHERLLELNAVGYLNGHTPFSAYLAFLGVTVAGLFGFPRVIASNERSSNEGNVDYLGTQINHQYSKTYHFEMAFDYYSRKYLCPDIGYFSLLRPLYELQIVRLLARHPQYLGVFSSCNKPPSGQRWCGRCPKCAFVYAALHAFVGPGGAQSVFGKDLYSSEELIPTYQELAGITHHKPFECVGTTMETTIALYRSYQRAHGMSDSLPPVLRIFEERILPRYPALEKASKEVLKSWGKEHNIPPEYVDLLRGELEQA